jgi:hypothetical protein
LQTHSNLFIKSKPAEDADEEMPDAAEDGVLSDSKATCLIEVILKVIQLELEFQKTTHKTNKTGELVQKCLGLLWYLLIHSQLQLQRDHIDFLWNELGNQHFDATIQWFYDVGLYSGSETP